MADVIGLALVQTDAADTRILDKGDDLPLLVKDGEVGKQRMRRTALQLCLGKMRTALAGGQRNPSHLGRHKGNAFSQGHIIAHQLNNQLEGAIKQRRMQQVLIELGFKLDRRAELRKHGAVLDPAEVSAGAG